MILYLREVVKWVAFVAYIFFEVSLIEKSIYHHPTQKSFTKVRRNPHLLNIIVPPFRR